MRRLQGFNSGNTTQTAKTKRKFRSIHPIGVLKEMAEDDTRRNIVVAPAAGFKRRTLVTGAGRAAFDDTRIGYLYFLRTREFRLMERPVYKVGMTVQAPDTRIARLERYTKGSEIVSLEQMPADRVVLAEKALLEALRVRFVPGPDGSEDFVIPDAKSLVEARDIFHRVAMEAISHGIREEEKEETDENE